jgi:hypothetical protein
MTRLDDIEARLTLPPEGQTWREVVTAADLRDLLKIARAAEALADTVGPMFERGFRRSAHWSCTNADATAIARAGRALRAALDERSDTEASDD